MSYYKILFLHFPNFSKVKFIGNMLKAPVKFISAEPITVCFKFVYFVWSDVSLQRFSSIFRAVCIQIPDLPDSNNI